MKQLHIFLIVFLMLSNTNFLSTRKSISSETTSRPRAIIRITFGAPPPSCTRFGICQVEVLPGILKTTPGTAIADCETDATGSKLKISIDLKYGMDQETFQRYFSSAYFITESEYIIGADVASELNIRSGSVIPAGQWQITNTGERISFVTDLR